MPNSGFWYLPAAIAILFLSPISSGAQSPASEVVTPPVEVSERASPSANNMREKETTLEVESSDPNAMGGKAEVDDTAKSTSAKNKVFAADDDYELMRMFVDTLDEVQQNYVQPISRRELMEAAIDGMLSKLDVYSDYIDPKEIDRFRKEVESEFGGIGIQVESRGGALKIVTPLPDSPGQRAGLLPGDAILEVDGKATDGWDIEKAVKRMKGPLGSLVTLKVRRTSGEEASISIRRGKVEVETVMSHRRQDDGRWDYMLDPKNRIGYIRISSFSAHTVEELLRALGALRAQGFQSLILDLRFNPGGLLTAAIEVSDLFLDHGVIVSTSGRNVEAKSWSARKEGSFVGFPLVVLVNRFSASASEIVSACLQDNQRATVIGERTWGKGSVQKVIELEQGKSALKLTTSSYLRPNGENIHRFDDSSEEDAWGVRPNLGFEVPMSGAQLRELRIFQMESAIMGPSRPPARELSQLMSDPHLKMAVEHLRALP